MAGDGHDSVLRHLLRRHRTEIAMAVDSAFPLLHALADHDVVPDDKLQVDPEGPRGVRTGWRVGGSPATLGHCPPHSYSCPPGDPAPAGDGRLPPGRARAPVLAAHPGRTCHPGLLEGSLQGLQPGALPGAAACPGGIPPRWARSRHRCHPRWAAPSRPSLTSVPAADPADVDLSQPRRGRKPPATAPKASVPAPRPPAKRKAAEEPGATPPVAPAPGPSPGTQGAGWGGGLS